MPRGQQQIRQWRLLHLLASRRGRTIPELMQEIGCSRRTAWRDLEVLQAVGFPITNERDGRESRYRLIEGPRGLSPIPFTLTELLSLHLGRHLLLPLRATPFGEPIQTALKRWIMSYGKEVEAIPACPGAGAGRSRGKTGPAAPGPAQAPVKAVAGVELNLAVSRSGTGQC